MCRIILFSTLACALSFAGLAAGAGQATSGEEGALLATVRIPTTVRAGEATLPPGTYEIRLTNQRPAPLAGQPANAQEWVEFVSEGDVIAREAAEVLYDDNLTTIGASAQPVRPGTRVDMLQGGEFMRISVKRERDRYLIHLPVQR